MVEAKDSNRQKNNAGELSGKRLGEYTLGRLLGQGGFAQVYLATHRDDPGFQAAIKVIRRGMRGVSDEKYEEIRKRFDLEAKLCRKRLGERVIRVFGPLREETGCLFLVMEYAEGGTLADWIERVRLGDEAPFEIDTVQRIGIEIAEGLAPIHARNLVHRDVKPSNILLTRERHVLVADLGLAQTLESRLERLERGSLPKEAVGDPLYRPPEQARGEAVEFSADIYALGATLFEMLTTCKYTHYKGESVRELRPEAPSWLDEIIAIAVRDNPAERFQTAAKIQTSLEQEQVVIKMPGVTPLLPKISVPPLQLTLTLRPDSPLRLAEVSEQAWEAAVDYFWRGRIGSWLQGCVDTLETSYLYPVADEWSKYQERAESIVGSVKVPPGDRIERSAGYVEFLQSIEGFQPPRAEIEPQQILDFGDLGVGGDPVARTITVTNAGRGILEGVVEPSHPALGVLEEQPFACGPGESAKVEMSFQPDESFFRPTPPEVALRIRTNAGQFDLDVHYRVLPPEVKLSPRRLRFRDIDQTGQVTLTISNAGHGLLTGKLVHTAPWLGVELESGEKTFRCKPDGEVQLRVSLVPSNVPAGGTEAPEALVLDTNAGRYTVAVEAPAPPRLKVEPEFLDFGKVDFVRGSIKPRSLVLRVLNSGTGRLDVKALPQIPGLSVSPGAFTCAAGETKECTVTLGKDALLPPPPEDRLVFERGILIESNGGAAAIGGRYAVSLPAPYVFAPGKEARTLKEFVALCIDEWPLAVEHFSEGRFEPWLRDELRCPDLAKQAKKIRRSVTNDLHEALICFLEVTKALDAHQRQKIVEEAVKAIAAEKSKKLLAEQADDLTTIRGIGLVMQQRLNEAGVYTFAQLAGSAPDELRRVKGAATLAEEWVAQAQELAWPRPQYLYAGAKRALENRQYQRALGLAKSLQAEFPDYEDIGALISMAEEKLRKEPAGGGEERGDLRFLARRRSLR